MTESERIESIKKNGGRHLQNFKNQNITYGMCCAAVEDDGTAICFVPEKYRTAEIYRLACITYGTVLRLIPLELITIEMCKSAVSNDGMAIEYVPEEFRTKEIYLMAAKNNPLVMQKMPIEYLDSDFCVQVIKSYGPSAISSLPKEIKKEVFYLPLVMEIPELLWNIPQKGRTALVCKTAIKSMGYDSTAEAIRDNPRLLSQLHTSLYDYNTCMTFVGSTYFQKGTENNSHGFNTDSDSEKGLLYLYDCYEERYSLKH